MEDRRSEQKQMRSRMPEANREIGGSLLYRLPWQWNGRDLAILAAKRVQFSRRLQIPGDYIRSHNSSMRSSTQWLGREAEKEC
jgi:hypothetical protein